jgi:SMC interacting uncharacterized protein involved in chromosome segregation
MTKEQLQRFVNELSDTEQIVIFAYTKFDIDYERESDNLPKLTDEQWDKFRYWMNKYVDVWEDYNDALHYAMEEK